MTAAAVSLAAEPPPIKHPQLVLWAVCLLGLMSTMGVAMPYPILAPIFVNGPADAFTRFAGLDPKLLMGLALAANPLGILLGSLFIGPLSDRYGRRAVLAVTLLATLGGYLLTAYALQQRWYLLFVAARFVTGLTEGNVAVARALLADMHGQIDRTRAFALLNAFLYMGWLLGPLVGGLTLHWGEPVPFVLAGLAMLPCLIVLSLGVPASPRASGPMHLLKAMREQQALGLLAGNPVLAALFALQLCFTLGVNSLYEFAPLWMLEQLGLDGRGIAWVTAGQCAVMTAASMLAGRWPLRLLTQGHHPLRSSALAALSGACCIGALALVPGQAGLALIMLSGLPLSLYNAFLPAWMSERFAEHGQGRVMGLLSTVFCVANVAIALIGGALALLSVRWIMALGGLMCGVAALLLLRLAAREEEARALRP
ncbi:MFS transporter [Paucibacter soli]|uniref:MFS transporter n=1 Tax=Paucibacter soli TaxID=3133433 RepID=UPI0030971113